MLLDCESVGLHLTDIPIFAKATAPSPVFFKDWFVYFCDRTRICHGLSCVPPMSLDGARLPAPVDNFDPELRRQWFGLFSHKLRNESVYHGRRSSEFSRIVTRLGLPRSNQDKMLADEIMRIEPNEFVRHEVDELTRFDVDVEDPPADSPRPWNPRDRRSPMDEVDLPDLDEKNYTLHLLAFVDERPAGLMVVKLNLEGAQDTVRLYIKMVVVSPLFRGIGLVRHLLEAYDELLVKRVSADYNVVSEFVTKPYNVTTGLHIAAERRGFETESDVREFDSINAHPVRYKRTLQRGQEPPPSGTRGIIGFSSTVGQPVCANCRKPSRHPPYRPDSSRVYNEVPWVIDPETLTHVFVRGWQTRPGIRKKNLYLCEDCKDDPDVMVNYEIDRRQHPFSTGEFLKMMRESNFFDGPEMRDEEDADRRVSSKHGVWNPQHKDYISGGVETLQRTVQHETNPDQLVRYLKHLAIGQELWDTFQRRLVANKSEIDPHLHQDKMLFMFKKNGKTRKRYLCVQWRPLCKLDYIQLRVFVSTAMHHKKNKYRRTGPDGLTIERLYDACDCGAAVGCFVHDRLSIVCVAEDETAPDPDDAVHWTTGSIPAFNLPPLENMCSRLLRIWLQSQEDAMDET